MPVDLTPLFAAEPPLSPQAPLSAAHSQHARDEVELISLRATVASLLEEIGRAPAPHGAGVLDPLASVTPATGLRQMALALVASPEPAVPHSEFLSMLAHELRNPLQSMAMASQLLAGATVSAAAVAQAHGVLERQIGHMAHLLDDLLEASRAATGKIVLRVASVPLRDVLNAAIETSQSGVQRRQQNLHVELPFEPVALSGDLIRLAQVFSNLLSNASQFSDMYGCIAVKAVCRDGFAVITVSDDGAGIPPELQPFVFDMFRQGQSTLDRASGGLGIGLSLVRTIVGLHGGTATVSSAGVGAGSSFVITLPLAAVAPPAVSVPAAQAGAARKILVIEDNVDANEIMAMLLEMEGHRVSSSFNGTDGLEQALAGDYDIVLCDLGLPGLTGFEVVAALKAALQARAPFVIATTGYSDCVQRDLARAAGFDHFLVKPLDLPQLFAVISERASTP